MRYQLRLFENGTEVCTTTVKCVVGSPNYPLIGETIGSWKVLDLIYRSEAECWLRVERINSVIQH